MEKARTFYRRALSSNSSDLRNATSDERKIAKLKEARTRLEKDFYRERFKCISEIKDIESIEETTDRIASDLRDFLSERWKQDAGIVGIVDECLKHKLGFQFPPVIEGEKKKHGEEKKQREQEKQKKQGEQEEQKKQEGSLTDAPQIRRPALASSSHKEVLAQVPSSLLAPPSSVSSSSAFSSLPHP